MIHAIFIYIYMTDLQFKLSFYLVVDICWSFLPLDFFIQDFPIASASLNDQVPKWLHSPWVSSKAWGDVGSGWKKRGNGGDIHMGVSKNRGTPKWMIYMEIPIKMDDLGVPPFSETPIWKMAPNGKREIPGKNTKWYCWWFRNPVNSPVEDGSLSHYLLRVLYIPGG